MGPNKGLFTAYKAFAKYHGRVQQCDVLPSGTSGGVQLDHDLIALCRWDVSYRQCQCHKPGG